MKRFSCRSGADLLAIGGDWLRVATNRRTIMAGRSAERGQVTFPRSLALIFTLHLPRTIARRHFPCDRSLNVWCISSLER